MRGNGLRLSLAQQWLLIAVTAMVPLLVVVPYSSWSLYQQIHAQRDIVQEVRQANEWYARTTNGLRELERSMRQYHLLKDERMLLPYQDKLNGLEQTAGEIGGLMPAPENESAARGNFVAEQQHPLSGSRQILIGLIETLRSRPLMLLSDSDFRQHLDEFAEVRARLAREVESYTQQLSAEGESKLEGVLWSLSGMTAIAVPLTLLLMALGFWQMIRPVRRLSMAIRNLGEGDWSTPIHVPGPKDLEALGGRLEWMRGQLTEADRHKQIFLQHVSHELKTPLSAIIEAGALLSDEVPGTITNEQRVVLTILIENARRLEELIQQLLNYNVLRDGFYSQAQSIDLKALVDRIKARLDEHSPGHKIQWKIGGKPAEVDSDPRLLEMILSNLLSNAFYYSPTDATVTVCWGRDDEFWISVQDQGPGISVGEQERIFEPFVQSENKRHGPLRGSGVGLAIVREAAHTLRGSIQVESIPGEGSKFLLRFPLN